MRGKADKQTSMLSLRSPDERVAPDHRLREVKRIAAEVLSELSPLLEGLYSKRGRHSIPPERLLKASILMALHSVRSERLFCEQLDYNLLYRWFLCLMAATGTAERDAATRMVNELGGVNRVTVGADKGCDTTDFVNGLRLLNTTPHIAQRKHSAIDAAPPRRPGTPSASASESGLKRCGGG